jgi:hypothetical protein
MLASLLALVATAAIAAGPTAGPAAATTTPKAEAKPETKPEAKSEPKPETKPEAKSEPKSEPKPETKPQPKSEGAADAPPPRVAVPALVGVDAKKGAAPHKALLAALEKAFDPRFVAVAEVLKAQADAGVTGQDLLTPTGAARLATATNAERVIVVVVEDAATRVLVYASLDGAPPLELSVARKKKTEPLDNKWAAAVANAVVTSGSDALAARAVAPVIDLSEPEPPPPPPAPPPSPPLLAKPLPFFVAGAVGGGVAVRSLSLEGPLADKLVAPRFGPQPSLSAYVVFAPTRLLDGDRTGSGGAWWSDTLVEVAARRALIDARGSDGTVCGVDDDEFAIGAAFRARVVDHAFVPRVGAGVGYGVERFVFSGCAVPAPSLSTTVAQGSLRVAQPIWPGVIEADLTLGGRVPLLFSEQSFDRPGALGSLAIIAVPVPHVFVRAAARFQETRVQRDDLVVGDQRGVFELQVGGAL